MKVLHISTSDRQGGAAIAAYRLNEALQNEGVDSKMLVYNKGIKEQIDTITNSYNKWLYLFHISSC